MGLRTSSILTIIAVILILLLFHIIIAIFFARSKRFTLKKFSWKTPGKYIATGILIICFLTSLIIFSLEHFRMNPSALIASEAFPFFMESTAKHFYQNLGLKKTNRDSARLKMKNNNVTRLSSYPQKEIVRKEHKKYNIVWLACESLPASMFTDEIMPQTSAFAQKNAIRFNHHYSGGNVTRQGMFSMFYALPATYWNAFLKVCRGPLFIDWLNADNYSIECFSSANFAYPEFDKTIFFEVPSSNLHSDQKNLTWMRDRRNVSRLLDSIDTNISSEKPFFRFMFFESPHNPYEFPPDTVIRENYIEPFNEILAVKANAEKIRNRAVNACHHLDQQIGRILQHLEEKKLLNSTIIIIVGDHGEEYFEKEHLGHSSAFVEEQIRTPFVLYVPGHTPSVYSSMSSHLDIVPMLAPFLGVVNSPRDYSAGINLLAPDSPKRKYAVCANWREVFFIGEKYKSIVPTNSVDYAKQTITDINDKPLPSVEPFFKEYSSELNELQNDLTRFSQTNPNGIRSVFIWFIIGCFIIILILVDIAIVFWRKHAMLKRNSIRQE